MFPRGRHNHLFFNLRETGPLCGHVSIGLEYTLRALPDQLHCIHPILVCSLWNNCCFSENINWSSNYLSSFFKSLSWLYGDVGSLISEGRAVEKASLHFILSRKLYSTVFSKNYHEGNKFHHRIYHLCVLHRRALHFTVYLGLRCSEFISFQIHDYCSLLLTWLPFQNKPP